MTGPDDDSYIDISVAHAPWLAAIPDVEARLRGAVALTLAWVAPARAGAISVLLTDDESVRALNRTFRGQDKPTNVLSFPAVPLPVPHAPLGDIALAFETVCAEAARDQKNAAHHALHLAVHGTLHLLGYTHDDDGDAAAMELTERAILSALGVGDPYAANPQGGRAA